MNTRKTEIRRIHAALLCAALLLSGCAAPWSTFMMDDVMPAVVDRTTWLPLVDSVTVTRLSDGASVTVSGVEVETLYACFENIGCTRRTGGVTPMYSLSYLMTDGTAAEDVVLLGEYRGTMCAAIGEYRYRPVSIDLDLTYIENLLAEAVS